MLREKLGMFGCLVERFPSNLTDEIQRTVARKVHVVCSEENRLKVLDGVEQVERVVEMVPVMNDAYRHMIGIKNVWNHRNDYRKGVRARLAVVLFPDGDPRDLEIQERYENFLKERKLHFSSEEE